MWCDRTNHSENVTQKTPSVRYVSLQGEVCIDADNLVAWQDTRTLEIEYFESVMPPQRMAMVPLENWISSISSRISPYASSLYMLLWHSNALCSRPFLPGWYDGHIHLSDFAQQLGQGCLSVAGTHYLSLHSSRVARICCVASVPVPSPSIVLLNKTQMPIV